jgi:hypothetical protein
VEYITLRGYGYGRRVNLLYSDAWLLQVCEKGVEGEEGREAEGEAGLGPLPLDTRRDSVQFITSRGYRYRRRGNLLCSDAWGLQV